MKKVIVLLVVLAISVNAFADIASSKHNFTTGQITGGEICAPCHHPHAGADISEANAPLWSHTLTSAALAPYVSITSTATAAMDLNPTGTTKLCLSCHDGSLTLGMFKGSAGAGSAMVAGLVNTATSHPISFDYAAVALVDGDINDAGDNSGFGSTITLDLLDGDGKVQCTSCHDPHNNDNGSLLIYDNAASALCTACHAK